MKYNDDGSIAYVRNANIMVLNDLHITATPPEGCRPIYLDDIFTMLEQARSIAVDNKVVETVFTGDLFHRTALPYRELTRLIRMLKNWPGHKLAIAGNHDLGPEGIAGIGSTPLGTLFEAGVIQWLDKDIVREYDTGEVHGLQEDMYPVRVQWSPANWCDSIDDDPANAGLTRMDRVDWAFKVSHMSLMRPGKVYPTAFKLIRYDEVPTAGMDAIFNGHIHNDQGIRTVNDCTFVSLGSIGRVSRTDYNLRKPRVALVTITRNELKFLKIPLALAVEPEELYYAKAQPGVEIDEPMARFARDMERSLALEDVSLDEALSSVTGKGVDKVVVAAVKELLEKSGY